MRQKYFLVLTIICLVLFSGCTNQNSSVTSKAVANTQTQPLKSVDKVEVFHFHGTRQCYSCIRLGELAEKTVKTYFQEELASGKLVFGHVNVDLEENKEVKDKYGAAGSSLFIGVYIGEQFFKEENTKVWYKINDEIVFLSYLKEILEKRFSGSLE